VYDSFIAALEHLAKGTQGLSGVMGNYHAPFLGEGATATSPPYPEARESKGQSVMDWIGVQALPHLERGLTSGWS
jgi:hypothetical protein